jgi:hypothetical protein
VGNFYTDTIRKDPRFNSTVPIHDVNLLEPGTRLAVAALLADARSKGYDLRSTETYRSATLQQLYFEKHETELRHVGAHHWGLACDFVLFVDGVYQERGEDYAFLAQLAPKHGLISGITWGTPKIDHPFKDWDHVQRIPVFRQDALFNGDFYPPSLYDPHADSVEHGIHGL